MSAFGEVKREKEKGKRMSNRRPGPNFFLLTFTICLATLAPLSIEEVPE
jgi:hypothetical protein